MAANDYYGGGKPQNQYYPPQGPPQGQGGYYPGPQAPQQSYQGYPQQGYPQQGYGGGYQPQPQPQTVIVQQPEKGGGGGSGGCMACLAGMCLCCCAEGPSAVSWKYLKLKHLQNCANACFNRALCSPGCGPQTLRFSFQYCDMRCLCCLSLSSPIMCLYIS
ncbi:hypothetical protein EDD18DRAFT_728573 [Armillaria luteobubalina]|uniref:Cysteine-rich transmembrane CYSTM domain-containing protein n=1 Tax=Armillaria luteobubalina TaxID=153913 RepID=A0AA39QE83_9AGAR|nr:hypothetical protein EDD18DRAFT_728573 [Armillaria luteobubalina]